MTERLGSFGPVITFSHRTMRRPLLAALLLPVLASAQDGGQLYTLYCGACHGPNGQGGPGGQFPPLAGSPWVAGDADRAIKVALHGLHGPVRVKGKAYHLEMPPQGAALSDEFIAAILTHIRSSWGNDAARVEPSDVRAARAATADRTGPWTAEEILKLHPLPLERTPLRDLISRTYRGTWGDLPDFSKLTPVNVEEEHDGIISLRDAAAQDSFAMLWEGGFEAPADGQYEFLLDADDAVAVSIDGKEVARVSGAGPMNGSRARLGKITLKRGRHPIRVEYFELAGVEGIAIGWKGPGHPDYRWLTEDTSAMRSAHRPIRIEPVNDRPIIYRNFIEGTTPRAIGVGFPGGLNLAYSADHLAPELIWTGNFIDGAFKWTERGTNPSPPAGENVVKLGDSRGLPDGARFRGYELDPAGNPTFVVSLGDQVLRDAWKLGQGPDQTPCLVRTLSLRGGTRPLRVALGRYPNLRSDVPTERRNGGQSILLNPGATTHHQYLPCSPDSALPTTQHR